MEKVYSHAGATPSRIPWRIDLPDGMIRTDPSTFTPEEIASAGYVEASAAPEYDPETHHAPQWNGAAWAVEPLTADELDDRFAQTKAAKRADLANIRWQHETGGIAAPGLNIPTDRETQTIVDRTVKAFDDGDLVEPINFKRSEGDWLTIDADTARLIKRLGAQHVQACFARECEIDGQIAAAADRAALDAIDLHQGWPA